MAVNKVVINTENGAETLIDLTEDNVTAETLAEGATAHDASGARIMGTMKAGGGTVEWKDIKNNPFGGGINSISWASRGIDPTTLPAETWVKMSDAVVTWEDVANIPEDRDLFSFIATDGVSYWNIVSNGFYAYPPFMQNGERAACVVVDDNGNMYNGIEFRPDGVFFYTGDDYGDGIRAYPLSVTVPGFKFETYEPIDSRYMPEGLQTETSSLTDTIAWESIYDDNYSVDPVKATGKMWLGQSIKVSDADIPVKSLPATPSGMHTIGEGDNVYGHYYLYAQEIENGFYKLAMTDENGNTMDYGYCATDGSGYDTGLYLMEWDGGTFTCYAGAVFEVKTPKPIDKKYLPDDIGMPEVTAEDNGKFLRVVDGVWSAVAVPNAEGVGF